MNYVPTSVGPSKLDLILAEAPDLSDESKEKVTLITDIARLGRLLGHPPMSPENFYTLYDMAIPVLEAVQHNAQVEWNTEQYHNRYRSL